MGVKESIHPRQGEPVEKPYPRKKKIPLPVLSESEKVNRRLRLEFLESPICKAGQPSPGDWALPVGKEGILTAMNAIHAKIFIIAA